MRRFAWMTVALGAAALVGCSSAPSKPANFEIPDYQKRVEEANRIAKEAAREAEEGNTDRAIELYREALSVSRDLAQAWTNLGALLMETGDFRGAAEAWTVAADLWPTDPRPMYNIGYAWLERYYPSDALTHFELALERDPNYQPALVGAIRASEWLNVADEELAERIRRAIFNETDPDWLEYLQRQKSRVDARLRQYETSADS